MHHMITYVRCRACCATCSRNAVCTRYAHGVRAVHPRRRREVQLLGGVGFAQSVESQQEWCRLTIGIQPEECSRLAVAIECGSRLTFDRVQNVELLHSSGKVGGVEWPDQSWGPRSAGAIALPQESRHQFCLAGDIWHGGGGSQSKALYFRCVVVANEVRPGRR